MKDREGTSMPLKTIIYTLACLVTLGASTIVTMPAAADSSFMLRNEMNNKYLELTGFRSENGAPAGMWDGWGGANQRWYWDGSQLRNKLNNKCLEIIGFNNENGAKVGLWDCWGGANQQWYWDGRQIRSKMNNKCLEITGFRGDNGAPAGMWDCWGGANQRWYQQ
ncbi:RICIN domain-containing protein [Sorangium sp. So ce124]|uniref:RICIN domain-containing protein n=1 Tax=Sorangium sp. So ce124 TaxID=3133280 RepID=UPI003F6337C2